MNYINSGFSKFKNWINKPIYFYLTTRYILYTSLIISISIYIFLFYFKPFNIKNDYYNFKIYLFGCSVISFLVIFTISYLLLLLNKDKNFTNGKHTLFIFIIVFVISTFDFLFEFYLSGFGFNLLNFWGNLVNTFSVAITPMIIYLFINEKRFSNKKLSSLKLYDDELKFIKSIDITLFSKNKKEKITFILENLVYIKSSGNYVSLFLYQKDNENKIKEKILRNTLSEISIQLQNYKTLVKVHRSFIINKSFVINYKGNAKGYKLYLSHINTIIPISRNFSKNKLEKLFK